MRAKDIGTNYKKVSRVKVVVLANNAFPPVKYVGVCREGMASPPLIVRVFIQLAVGMVTDCHVIKLRARFQFKRLIVFVYFRLHLSLKVLLIIKFLGLATTVNNSPFVKHVHFGKGKVKRVKA